MTITLTLGHIIFLVIGLVELALFVVYVRNSVRDSNSLAMYASMFMLMTMLATFFLFAGIYLW